MSGDPKETSSLEYANQEVTSRYTFAEDMAIINYMTTNKRYLQSSGIQVWKNAEKLKICPGRPYLSMKERYRKVIVKNLKDYNVDKTLVQKINEFMRATKEGKSLIRAREL